jgi:glycosyltransferase involved in cell wall biosynthesis
MKVSIITVSLNSSKSILRTIKSVNDQEYHNIEHVFIDGNSEDNTTEIIRRNSTRTNTIVIEPDNGIYDAMNTGIRMASGNIIGILNSDDVFASNNIISNIVKRFEGTNIDGVFANITYVNRYNQTVRCWNSSEFMKNSFSDGWHPPHPSLFLKKEVYLVCGLFDMNFKIAADFEFMLRIFEKSDLDIKFMNETVVNMLVGGKSNTLKGIIQGNSEIKLAFEKNGIARNKFYFIRRYFYKFYDVILLKWFYEN